MSTVQTTGSSNHFKDLSENTLYVKTLEDL